MNNTEFSGIIAGIVADNNDPDKLGRLKIRIPAAYADQPTDNLPWAWPCFPYGGEANMCSFAIPEIDAAVWVMFQCNDGEPDTSCPVWLGSWQPENGIPEQVEGDSEDAHCYKVFRTTSGHYMTFCDKEDEEFIEIKDKDNNYFRLDDKDEFVEIQDKDNNYFRFDDKEEFTEIKDKDGNYIRLDRKNGFLEIKDKSGSSIFMSDGNINITASGSINLKAGTINLN